MNGKENANSKESNEKLSQLANLVKEQYSRDRFDRGKIPQETDMHFYTRYLISKKWDVNKAFKQIVHMLEWREQESVDEMMQLSADEVLGGPVGIEDIVLRSFPMFGIPRTYDLPDVSASDTLTSTNGSGVKGVIRDSKGRLVFCYKVGRMIVDALVEHIDEAKFHKYTIWRFERMVKILGETVESKNGADKWILVFDLEGFSMSKHAKRSVFNVIKEFNGLGASCYRETVAQIYIINAPKPFSFAWSMVHPFLNSKTRKKIVMANGKGDDKLSEYVDISKRLPCLEK